MLLKRVTTCSVMLLLPACAKPPSNRLLLVRLQFINVTAFLVTNLYVVSKDCGWFDSLVVVSGVHFVWQFLVGQGYMLQSITCIAFYCTDRIRVDHRRLHPVSFARMLRVSTCLHFASACLRSLSMHS